jgi:predicted deacylase
MAGSPRRAVALVLRLTLVTWAFVAGAESVWAIDFKRYHSQEEINQYLRDVAAEHPELVKHHVLGYSLRGREIDYVVISKADPETAPAIYMNGTHHGNEKSSTEGILALIDYLVTQKDDPEVAALLEGYAIYAQPLVNPDGHAANTREDGLGRDPNRDYSFPDRPDSSSFRVPEIRMIKELADKVRFRAAAAWHSGMEGVLWPWCYSGQRTADHDAFLTLSRITAQAMGMRLYQQSYFDYETRGEFIDYLYMTQGTMAVTFEVSNAPTPAASQLASVVNRAVAGAMAFMLSIQDLDRGTLPLDRDSEAQPPARIARAAAAASGGAGRVE